MMSRPCLLLLALSGCFSGRDITTGIYCESTRNCPDGMYCSIEGGCFPADERWPEDTFCADDDDCLDKDHCQAGGHCHPGGRTSCSAYECSTIGPTVHCLAPRCLRAECFGDFTCGAQRHCEAHRCQAGAAIAAGSPDGAHCDEPAQCQGGRCLNFTDLPDNRWCSRTCDGNYPYRDCGVDTFCSPYNGVCFPRGALNYGAACDSNIDCHGGVCLSIDDGASYRCTSWCLSVGDCPSGWTCGGVSGLPLGVTVGACAWP